MYVQEMIYIVNLKRRSDRKTKVMTQMMIHSIRNYKIYEAVDGSDLVVTDKIAHMFAENDFGSNAGAIGCALSHYNLWLQLLMDPATDHYCILEDDIIINSWNYQVWTQIKCDVLFLGYSAFSKPTSDLFDKTNFAGGTFGYIIHKTGAIKMCKWIQENGIRHGIDYILGKMVPDLIISSVFPHAVTSPWVKSFKEGDTDIQGKNESIDLFSLWKFFPRLDHSGDDITRMSPCTLRHASGHRSANAFNSLGYIKNISNVNLEPSPFFRTNDGIWLKKPVRIHATCNWCSDENLIKELETMMGLLYIDSKFQFVTRGNVDFWVIINFPNDSSFKYNPKRTLVFCWEPSVGSRQWNEWSKPDPARFLYVQKECCAFWQLNYVSRRQLIGIRLDRISIILSEKYTDPGQKYRVDLVKYLDDTDLPIDVFGRENYHSLKCYRGQVTEPKEFYIQRYNYYLAIENNFENDYISEKFWEPILCETLPIYLGCTNIHTILPSCSGLVELAGSLTRDLNIIRNQFEGDTRDSHVNWLREIKKWTLDHSMFQKLANLSGGGV